jgi:hypothetical protein
MGRLGKVASPALCGNANQRLMRHKLTDTTLCERSDTESSRKQRSCGSARRPAAVRAVPAPTAHFRPNRPFFVAQGMQTRRAAPRYTSATRWQCAGNACVKPRGRAGGPRGPGDPSPTGHPARPSPTVAPARDRRYGIASTRPAEPEPAGKGPPVREVAGTGPADTGPRHTPADGGPAEGLIRARASAVAAARRSRQRRRRGRVRP